MPDSAPPSPALLDQQAARALLETTYPQPSAVVIAKDIGHIDRHIRQFMRPRRSTAWRPRMPQATRT